MTLLFVCTGNMHRSPLAAAMLRSRLARLGRLDLQVSSAGTVAIEGLSAVPEAVRLASEDGIDLTGHRSTPLTAAAAERADLILVMERSHRLSLLEICPAAGPRCRLLSDYLPGDASIQPGADVPDAVGEDLATFRRTYDILRHCVDRLCESLPAPSREIYWTAVESRFRSWRPTPLSLSPADAALIESWFERGVPLWIVLEAIDEAGRRRPSSAPRLRSLRYCRPAVEERFGAYLSSTLWAEAAGCATPQASGPADSRSEPWARETAQRYREAARVCARRGAQAEAAVLDGAARGVEEAAGQGLASAALRMRVEEIEERALGELARVAPSDLIDSLSLEARQRLEPHLDRMTAEAYQATLSRFVAHRIKLSYGLS